MQASVVFLKRKIQKKLVKIATLKKKILKSFD